MYKLNLNISCVFGKRSRFFARCDMRLSDFHMPLFYFFQKDTFVLTGLHVAAWGINKFRKFGMDPNLIDNMEVEDFLSRIPSDPELEMLKEPSRHQRRIGT